MVDNASDEQGKEFYTIMTPDENVFYLIIDKQRDSENVYFLNAVTESDLMALAQKTRTARLSHRPHRQSRNPPLLPSRRNRQNRKHRNPNRSSPLPRGTTV